MSDGAFVLEPHARHSADGGVDRRDHTIDEIVRVDEIGMMPSVMTMTNLQTVKSREVDVIRQLRPAGEIVDTPSADQPDRHIATRSQHLESAPGVRR